MKVSIIIQITSTSFIPFRIIWRKKKLYTKINLSLIMLISSLFSSLSPKLVYNFRSSMTYTYGYDCVHSKECYSIFQNVEVYISVSDLKQPSGLKCKSHFENTCF